MYEDDPLFNALRTTAQVRRAGNNREIIYKFRPSTMIASVYVVDHDDEEVVSTVQFTNKQAAESEFIRTYQLQELIKMSNRDRLFNLLEVPEENGFTDLTETQQLGIRRLVEK